MEKRAKTTRNYAPLTAPLLLLFVLGAMYLSRHLLFGVKDASDLLLRISVVQVLILILPGMIYYLIKKRSFASPMLLSPIAPRHLPLLLFAGMTLVSGGLLIRFGYQIYASQSVEMVGFFDALTEGNETLSRSGVLIALVIIPAVCEELFFRGILLAEYRSMGEGNAVLVSAIGFSMLHFSVENFPVYVLAGLLLGVVTVASRSVLPSILLHLLNNFLNLYTSDRFLRIIMQKNGVFFVGFLLIVLFGFSLFLMLYGVEHLYRRYAAKPPVDRMPEKSFRHLHHVYLSPTFLLLAISFLLLTVLR